MHLCIFNHRSIHPLYSLHHLILHLLAQPYLGLVVKAAPLPVSFHPPSSAASFIPLSLFFLQGVLQTPCPFGKNLSSLLHS